MVIAQASAGVVRVTEVPGVVVDRHDEGLSWCSPRASGHQCRRPRQHAPDPRCSHDGLREIWSAVEAVPDALERSAPPGVVDVVPRAARCEQLPTMDDAAETIRGHVQQLVHGMTLARTRALQPLAVALPVDG
ncbi:hypothetical protein ASF82_02570 [Frigoribacterium sp. Leaf164]|nr:hypothetical protein ASF82_02570 [Frigoribacterium sp. Leaf164]